MSLIAGLDIGRHSARVGLFGGVGKDIALKEVRSLVSPFIEVGDFSMGDPTEVITIECTDGKFKDLDGSYLIGDTVTDAGFKVLVAQEGKEFVRNSCILILDLLLKLGQNGDYKLAHVLTDENKGTHSWYKEMLEGRSFKVSSVYNPSVSVDVHIEKLYVQSQSTADAYEILMDDDLLVRKDLFDSRGLCVNFGRKTVDFCVVSKLNIVSASSVPMGSYVMLKKLRDAVADKMGSAASEELVEDLILSPKITLDNKVIDFSREIKDAVSAYALQVKPVISQFLSQQNLSWICFGGGGSILLQEHLTKDLAGYKLLFHNNPTFSSTLGATKWLGRALLQRGE